MIKVEPTEHEGRSKAEKSINTKLAANFVTSVWTLAGFLGLLPFRVDKETKKCSFKWFSPVTVFSFIRLVLINFPFLILPAIFYFLYYADEWSGEEYGPYEGANGTNGTNGTNETSSGLSTAEFVQVIDYFSNFSLFILSELQNMEFVC